VAFRAGHGRCIEVDLVEIQPETGACMIEHQEGCLRRVEISPLVIWVADRAGIHLADLTMDSLSSCDLLVNILMAHQAFCPQVSGQWLMARAALLFKLSVRLVALELDPLAGFRRDLPWAESQPAVVPQQPCQSYQQ
jgi:hypothetical protein